MMSDRFIPLPEWRELSEARMRRRARDFYMELRRRRTVRDFLSRSVARDIIENCVRAAGTAPNGANMQPWHFVVVSDPAVKKRIRADAEKEDPRIAHPRNGWKRLHRSVPMNTSPFLKPRRISSRSSARNTVCCRMAAR